MIMISTNKEDNKEDMDFVIDSLNNKFQNTLVNRLKKLSKEIPGVQSFKERMERKIRSLTGSVVEDDFIDVVSTLKQDLDDLVFNPFIDVALKRIEGNPGTIEYVRRYERMKVVLSGSGVPVPSIRDVIKGDLDFAREEFKASIEYHVFGLIDDPETKASRRVYFNVRFCFRAPVRDIDWKLIRVRTCQNGHETRDTIINWTERSQWKRNETCPECDGQWRKVRLEQPEVDRSFVKVLSCYNDHESRFTIKDPEDPAQWNNPKTCPECSAPWRKAWFEQPDGTIMTIGNKQSR
jgi:hypothetical protein